MQASDKQKSNKNGLRVLILWSSELSKSLMYNKTKWTEILSQKSAENTLKGKLKDFFHIRPIFLTPMCAKY